MIPLVEPEVGVREREAVDRVLASGNLAAGEEVAAFESEFAATVTTDHAVATSNGTTALHAIFEALDLPNGSTVLTSPFSFVASANAPRFAGHMPVFADIDPETYTLDPDRVEERLQEDDSVGAILAVHLYGLPADLDRLRALADEYDVALVEDAAQAHGATYEGEPVGSFGDAAAFSFYPTKNMTTGEGGVVTTDREELADRISRFINHGRDSSGYDHAELGHNFRMTDVAAALGRAQIEKLPVLNECRRANAATLDEHLADAGIETPTEPDGRRHVYNQYTVRTSDRDALRRHLDDRGIGSGVYYPQCIHEQPAFEWADESFPVAERAAEEVLSLPVCPALSTEEVDEVGRAVAAFGGGRVDA